jgi:hypothetical protein
MDIECVFKINNILITDYANDVGMKRIGDQMSL